MLKLKSLFVGLCSFVLIGHALAAEMIVTTEVPLSHWKSRYVQEFADGVTKRTGGKLTVKVFPAGQLYNDKDALGNLGTGTVHMVWPISGQLELLAPKAGILGIPFLLSDELMLQPGFSKGMSNIVSEPLEKRNIEVMGLLRATDAIFVFKDKQVRAPKDLAGLKIRSPAGAKAQREAFIKLGASPVALPASEMSPALAQGVIDGMTTSPAAWRTIIGDTAKYGSLVPGMILATYTICVDRKWLQALPADQRKAVEDSIAEVADNQWKEGMAEEESDIKKMVAGGATFWRASKAETMPWRDAMKFAGDDFRKKYPDAMGKYDQLVKQYGQ